MVLFFSLFFFLRLTLPWFGLAPAGIPLKTNLTLLKEDPPHIVVGTPGRVKDLLGRPDGLKLDKVKVRWE